MLNRPINGMHETTTSVKDVQPFNIKTDLSVLEINDREKQLPV